jgi:hypothetical protein
MFDKYYQYFSKIFLELISNNLQFKIDFQVFAPQIFADIESFSKNPNCSCRSKIENYVLDNRDICYTFLQNYIDNKSLKINLQEIEEKYKTIIYSGKRIEVKKDQWYMFSEALKKDRALYKSFSILEKDYETVEVYFL